MSDDKIKELPVKFKPPVSDDVFLVVAPSACFHGSYKVDKDLMQVECGKCGAKLNPMMVLVELAHKETAWHRTREAYQDDMKRLGERQRTKCQHCGKMTRIRGI